jgi:uncharacterized membrane protein HdeD (DUF308 family)
MTDPRYPKGYLLRLVEPDAVREHRGRFIALGIALVVLGVLAMLAPYATGLVTAVVLGWLIALAGVAEAIHAMLDREWGGSVWAIIGALFYVAAGALFVAFPQRGKVFLTIVLTGLLAVDGAHKLIRAAQHRAVPYWGWLLFDGILSLCFAFLVWRHWPSTASWALGLMVGLAMVFNGSSMLVLALGAGRTVRASV